MKTVVSEKGQITIPKAIREKMGLQPGTVLEIDSIEGKIIAEKRKTIDIFKKWRGKYKLPGNLTVNEYIQKIRE